MVGQRKAEGSATYNLYYRSKKGYLATAMPQVKTADDAVSLGEIAAEIALTGRPVVEDADGSESEKDSGDEEDEGEDDGTDDEAMADGFEYKLKNAQMKHNFVV